MTLVVAVATPAGAWLGGERRVGDFGNNTLAGPKVFRLETAETDKALAIPFGVGFAGNPRVAQTILAVTPPAWQPSAQSLHWWLTTYCDRIHDRAADVGQMVTNGKDGAELAGDSGFVLAIDGRVFLVDSELSWEELDRGYAANGGGWSFFAGAYEALSGQVSDRVERARAAWPAVQQLTNIGPLVDELEIPKAT